MIQFAVVMAVVLVFTLGLIWGLVMIDRRGKKDPEELLRERFVQGEIDEKEYARKLSILKFGPPLELD